MLFRSGRDYYWRVRPRVQGDGAPTDWTPAARFRVDTATIAPVRVRPIQFGLVADAGGCGVLDPATTFPTSPTLTAVSYSYAYQGGGRVVHRWLAGDREVDYAAFDLPADRDCWDARFRLGSDLPARPGDYTLQVWQGGRLVQSGAFNVAAEIGRAHV